MNAWVGGWSPSGAVDRCRQRQQGGPLLGPESTDTNDIEMARLHTHRQVPWRGVVGGQHVVCHDAQLVAAAATVAGVGVGVGACRGHADEGAGEEGGGGGVLAGARDDGRAQDEEREHEPDEEAAQHEGGRERCCCTCSSPRAAAGGATAAFPAAARRGAQGHGMGSPAIRFDSTAAQEEFDRWPAALFA